MVLEAMKMENELKAAAPGVVKTVRVAPGEAVEKGQVLVEFERRGRLTRTQPSQLSCESVSVWPGPKHKAAE